MVADRVGIVVLTFNRRDEVVRTLSKIEAIGDDVPIVVVDNASTDGTAEAIARHHARARVITLPRNVGAAGRNAGVRACERPYIAFCDDDTWWLPDAIECAAAALDAYPSLASVTARVLVGEDRGEDPTNARMAASPLPNTLGIRGSELVGLLGGACMVRRDAFLAVGGYDPRLFLGGEEALLAIDLRSAGWRMAYLPDAVVCHHPSALRDARARQRLALRNALWCAWLRRPLSSAMAASCTWWRDARRNGTLLRDAFAALRGLAWVLRERRVVPAHVEAALRTIEAFYAGDNSDSVAIVTVASTAKAN